MGAGPAGNGIAQAAKYLGASQVVITDRADRPLDLARRYGADHVVDVRDVSAEELALILGALANEGYGSVFDSVGTEESFHLGLKLLGKAGTLVNMAVHDQAMPINFMDLGSERKVTTSCNFAVGDYPLALSWLEAGRFQVKDWLSDIQLADVPGLFAEIDGGRVERPAFKMVIRF